MRDVTVGIKTFIRVLELESALASLVGKDFFQVIVADDSKMDARREQIYDRFSKVLPLVVLELPFDSGISVGRNQIVSKCQTDYFLLMDDDLICPDDIQVLRLLLDSDERCGGVSCIVSEFGQLVCAACDLFEFSDCIVKDRGFKKRKATYGTASFYEYDFMSNFALFKTNIFEDIKWDENYKIMREHVDFFLSHKTLDKWKFFITEDLSVRHVHGLDQANNPVYEEYRRGPERQAKSIEYFNKKWDKQNGLIDGLKHNSRWYSYDLHIVHQKLKLNGLFRFYR